MANYLSDLHKELYRRIAGMNQREPWEYIDGEEIYYKDLEILNIIENYLFPYLEIPPMELFGIMSSDEKMSMTSIARQKGLPLEMKDEISKYVGINPKGGIRRSRTQRKRKSYHNKKRHNKSKYRKIKKTHKL